MLIKNLLLRLVYDCVGVGEYGVSVIKQKITLHTERTEPNADRATYIHTCEQSNRSFYLRPSIPRSVQRALRLNAVLQSQQLVQNSSNQSLRICRQFALFSPQTIVPHIPQTKESR